MFHVGDFSKTRRDGQILAPDSYSARKNLSDTMSLSGCTALEDQCNCRSLGLADLPKDQEQSYIIFLKNDNY